MEIQIITTLKLHVSQSEWLHLKSKLVRMRGRETPYFQLGELKTEAVSIEICVKNTPKKNKSRSWRGVTKTKNTHCSQRESRFVS